MRKSESFQLREIAAGLLMTVLFASSAHAVGSAQAASSAKKIGLQLDPGFAHSAHVQFDYQQTKTALENVLNRGSHEVQRVTYLRVFIDGPAQEANALCSMAGDLAQSPSHKRSLNLVVGIVDEQQPIKFERCELNVDHATQLIDFGDCVVVLPGQDPTVYRMPLSGITSADIRLSGAEFSLSDFGTVLRNF